MMAKDRSTTDIDIARLREELAARDAKIERMTYESDQAQGLLREAAAKTLSVRSALRIMREAWRATAKRELEFATDDPQTPEQWRAFGWVETGLAYADELDPDKASIFEPSELAEARAEIERLAVALGKEKDQTAWLTGKLELEEAARKLDVQRLTKERDEWRAKADNAIMHAQSHAMEARTANASLREAYQAATGATGEPGSWNGAEPIKDALAVLRAQGAALAEALNFYADEATYHAISFVCDPPCGEFSDDFSQDEGSGYPRPMPGKRARAALSAIDAPTQAQPDASPPPIDRVVIWSYEHCMYWRPNRSGYTRDIAEAGLYSREEAEEIVKHCGPEKRVEIREVSGRPQPDASAALDALEPGEVLDEEGFPNG